MKNIPHRHLCNLKIKIINIIKKIIYVLNIVK